MLKILQISNKAPYPPNDGSSIAIYNMAVGLLENNVQLHVLTINTKKHFKPDSEVPSEFKKSAHYLSVYKNTNTNPFGALLNLFSTQSYFVSRFYFKRFNKRLIDILAKNNFDIVQLEGLFMAVYLNTLRGHSRAKIVLRAHNVEHYIWNRHVLIEKNGLKKWYLQLQNKRLKAFELSILSKVDAVMPITKIDAEELIKLGCRKPIYTCVTGVDVAAYQVKSSDVTKPNTVFYFGSMDWLPNQEAVLWFLENCWEKVLKAVPESIFVVAGRGMPAHFLKINKPNVLLVDSVLDGKQFYHQHQIMVVPLWSGSGLRIKIIEGMAFGKAIVSTSIGAEGINYIENESIVIANNAEDFSAAVIDLLKNPDKRMSLEKHAAEIAQKEFDNAKVVSGVVNFYNQLIE